VDYVTKPFNPPELLARVRTHLELRRAGALVKIQNALLVEKNQRWAARCPLLMFVLARRQFKEGGRENRHAPFDAGSAWMSVALQARRLGLYAHAMAGFSLKKAYEVLGVSEEDYLIMAAIAVGRKGDADQLPEDLRTMESPNARKPQAEVATDKFPLA
jgi:nitroreductase